MLHEAIETPKQHSIIAQFWRVSPQVNDRAHPTMTQHALRRQIAWRVSDTSKPGRPGGYVATVVRGSGDDAARSRLRSGYDTGDAELLATFDRLAEGRLKVFAGLLPHTRRSSTSTLL